jgi:hypothetical protein
LIVGQDEWIEHRRRDGELIGWMRPQDKGFVPVDRLGRDLSAATDWLSAERLLDETGIAYLADALELRHDDGSWQRVRVVEVSLQRSSGSRRRTWERRPRMEYILPFPAPGSLRAALTELSE